MTRKFFAWAMVLAMVLTLLPMADVHNHAQAEELMCSQCAADGKSCNAPWGFIAGLGLCSKCYHPQGDHKPAEEAHVCEFKETFRQDATCVEEGWKKMECECGTHMTPWPTIPIDPDAHNLVNNKCTNVNSKTQVKCDYHVCTWAANGEGKCQTVDSCTATHAHTDADFTTMDPASYVSGTCMTEETFNLLCKDCGAPKATTGAKNPDKHSWNTDGTCANGCTVICTHPTYKDGKCETCSYPHAHEDADWKKVEESYVAATCVNPDTWTEKCGICGATKECAGAKDPDAHKWNTTTGQCDNTGCEFSCPHNYVDGVCTECTLPCKHEKTHNEPVTAATCKREGTANVVCDACGTVTGEATLPVDPEGHNWIEFSFGRWVCALCMNQTKEDPNPSDDPTDEPTGEPTDKPTCPDNNHEWVEFSFGGWFCVHCGTIATDMGPLDPDICNHADTYLETVTPATCKDDGVAKEICDICETVLDENVVLPADPDNMDSHDWVEFSFGAGFCVRCYEISVDDDYFHDHDKVEEDTCEHEWVGFSFGRWVCVKCLKQTTEDPTVPEEPEEPEEPKDVCEDHEWVKYSFGGWFCVHCGTIATDMGPLDPEICDHDDTYIDVITPATCKTPGVGNKKCDICETLLEENVEVPVDPENGHKWYEEIYCELCGETKPADPADNCDHDWVYYSFGGLICKHCMTIGTFNCEADRHYTDNGRCAACGALKGDVVKDGNIDNRDVLRALHMKGGAPTWAADMNDNGSITNIDVLAILQSK